MDYLCRRCRGKSILRQSSHESFCVHFEVLYFILKSVILKILIVNSMKNVTTYKQNIHAADVRPWSSIRRTLDIRRVVNTGTLSAITEVHKSSIVCNNKREEKSMNFEFLQVISSLLSSYSFVFIAMALFYLLNYLKRYNKLKKVEFTQKLIEDNKQLIEDFYTIIFFINYEPYEEKNKSEIFKVYKIINYFSCLAEGVEQGIYDEDVIKVNYRNEMKLAHSLSYNLTTEFNSLIMNYEVSLSLEFLLKKWENKKVKSHKKVNF